MPQNGNSKRNKKAYLNDFQQSLTGEYIYLGVTYAFDGSKQQRKHLYYKLLALSILLAAAQLVSGWIPAPGTLNCFYVLIPYLFSLLASVSLVWGLCRLWAGGSPLREYVYQATVEQFRPRGVCTAAGAGLSLLCEMIYVLRNGTLGLVPGMILFLVCQAAVLASALLWMGLTGHSRWIRKEPQKR